MPILNPNQGNNSSGGSGSGLTPAESALLYGAQQTSEKNQQNGYAGLDAAGFIDQNQIPNAIADQVTNTFDISNLNQAPNSAAIKTQLDNKVDIPSMPDGEVPVFELGTSSFVGSGIKKVQTGPSQFSLLLPDNAKIESHSLSIGDTISLGEAGSFLINRNKIDNKNYCVVDYLIDPVNGTSTPHIMWVAGEVPLTVQPVITSTITGTSVTVQFTSTALQLITSAKFKTAAMMSNVRMRVKNVTTGDYLKHWPSIQDWYAEQGETWAVGDNEIDLDDNQFQLDNGTVVELEIAADSLALLGTATEPFLEVKTERGRFVNIATEEWADDAISTAVSNAITSDYDKNDTTKAITAAAAESRFVAFKSEIDAGTYIGTWNASTNTPTLTNPPTNDQGDFYEVTTAGTQFGTAFAVGDLIICGVNTSGVKVWYKRAYSAGIFDSRSVYVSQTSGNDAYAGTESRRKATLAGAIAVVAQPGSIDFSAGAYNIGAVTISKQNINLLGKGSNANNNVEFAGQITTGVGRLRLRNINFTNGGGAAFTWADATGSHHIQDCSVTSNQIGPVFVGAATARGFSTISNGDFGGSVAANNIVLNNLSSGAAVLYLVNLANVRISVGSGWLVYVNACPDIQISGNAVGVVWTDTANVNAILTEQSQLDALLTDLNVSSDGYYVCDFASPSIGARNDILLKRSVQGIATNIKVNKTYLYASAAISVKNGSNWDVYTKLDGGWSKVGSGGGDNFANANLTANDNRVHDFANHDLTISNIDNLILQANRDVELKGIQYASVYTENDGGALSSSVAMYDTDLDGHYTEIVTPELRINADVPNMATGKLLGCLDDATGKVGWIAAPTGAIPKVVNQPIDKMSYMGVNGIMFLSKGKVYNAYGNTTFGYFSGRAPEGVGFPQSYGFDNMSQIVIPEKDGVAAIDFHTSWAVCAILYEDGDLYTWGGNNFGQCGQGNTTAQPMPKLAATGVTQIIVANTNVSYSHADSRLLIKKSDGYIYGCGYNASGQLGDGTTATRTSFIQLAWIGQNPKAVFNVGSSHGCVIAQKSDGTIWGAGYDAYSQLGTGTAVSARSTPVNITTAWLGAASGYDLKQVEGGFGYWDGTGYSQTTLIMLFDNGTDSIVKTCGANTWGSIGNNTTTNRSTPFQPTIGTSRIVQIAGIGGGPATFFALNKNGQLYGWGHNNNTWGIAGVNSSANTINVPTLVTADVEEILSKSHASHTNSAYAQVFIKKTDGTLWGWGFDDGRGYTGTGTGTHVKAPKRTLLPGKVVRLGSMTTDGGGGRQYVAMNDRGELYIWGYGGNNGMKGYAVHDFKTPQRIYFGDAEIVMV